jgi:hypothetical protein
MRQWKAVIMGYNETIKLEMIIKLQWDRVNSDIKCNRTILNEVIINYNGQ